MKTKQATHRFSLSLLLLGVMFSAVSCSSIYFNTMEKLGYPKRDLLVKRVLAARETQGEAKEQFSSALEQFIAVTSFDGGSLEEKYNKLNGELERSEEKAEEVRSRISAIEEVAEALFEEWEDELEEYSSKKLRSRSSKALERTKDRYNPMIKAMRRAEKKMEPVLVAFRDQVLFLKHNLNARAIASLRDELTVVETDIAALIREMESSIGEAERFIAAMEASA